PAVFCDLPQDVIAIGRTMVSRMAIIRSFETLRDIYYPPTGDHRSAAEAAVESTTAKAASTEAAARKSAASHTAPPAETARSRCPPAPAEAIAETAEGVGASEGAIRMGPGIGIPAAVCGQTAVPILIVVPVFSPIGVSCVFECTSIVRVVIAVAIVIGAVVVPAVPGGVSVEVVVVVENGAAVPIGSPGSPPPSTTGATASQGA